MQDRNINYMNTKIFAPYYLLVAQSETSQQINLIYYLLSAQRWALWRLLQMDANN